MKLSKARLELLKEAEAGTTCVKVYAPANFLVLHKLVEWRDDDEYGGTLVITEDGRSALKQEGE